MKQDSKKLAQTYANSAFNNCIKLTLNEQDGQSEPSNYRLARVGVGDGLWVDSEGVLYIQSHGKFMPYSLIPSAFDQLSKENFDYTIQVPDSENPIKLKNIKAHKFGKRSMMVGDDGRLYLIPNNNTGSGFVGLPRGSCHDNHARGNRDLSHRAYEISKTGYDATSLQLARSHLAESDLPEEQKRNFSSKLDEIVGSFAQEKVEGGTTIKCS